MIRQYKKADKPKVLELVRLNTPEFFHPSEENDLNVYLENELEEYFVFEEEGEIVGAGGLNYFPKEQSARISWDVVSPEAHGKGIGSQLVQFRIKQAFSRSEVRTLIVRTSQLAYKFYEKQGFKLDEVKKDFWAEGYDLYLMSMSKS
ncbi:MAG: GNAT family N-acetyltransferase [Flavobacteriales bacterium]